MSLRTALFLGTVALCCGSACEAPSDTTPTTTSAKGSASGSATASGSVARASAPPSPSAESSAGADTSADDDALEFAAASEPSDVPPVFEMMGLDQSDLSKRVQYDSMAPRALRSGQQAYAWMQYRNRQDQPRASWFRVTVLGPAGTGYRVHFVGFSSRHDTAVSAQRMRDTSGRIVASPGASPPKPPPKPRVNWCGPPYAGPGNPSEPQPECRGWNTPCCRTGTCRYTDCHKPCVTQSVNGCYYYGCCRT